VALEALHQHESKELMRDRYYKIPDGNDLVLPPILFTKNAGMVQAWVAPKLLNITF